MSGPDTNRSFTELNVWKEARSFRNYIFDLVKAFPTEEKFMLVSQLIRASRSVGDNIAEGHGRFTYKDQLHFCIQARGSLGETYNHLITALDCKYISVEELQSGKAKFKACEVLLNGYITFLRKQIENKIN